MKELDEILFDALKANAEIVALTKGKIYSTCVEAPKFDAANTKAPFLVVMDEAFTNDLGTKDTLWEGGYDHVKASVVITGNSRKQVGQLRRMVRKAIADYVETLQEVPELTGVSNEGILYNDVMFYYDDMIHYQADMANHIYDDEQEENGSES